MKIFGESTKFYFHILPLTALPGTIPVSYTHLARAVIGIRYELRLRGLAEELPNYVFLEDASDDVRFAMLELNVPGMQVEASVERELSLIHI